MKRESCLPSVKYGKKCLVLVEFPCKKKDLTLQTILTDCNRQVFMIFFNFPASVLFTRFINSSP
jgi:hypothetical protein